MGNENFEFSSNSNLIVFKLFFASFVALHGFLALKLCFGESSNWIRFSSISFSGLYPKPSIDLLVVPNEVLFWFRLGFDGRPDLINFPNFSVLPRLRNSSELVNAFSTLKVGKVSTDINVVGDEGKDE